MRNLFNIILLISLFTIPFNFSSGIYENFKNCGLHYNCGHLQNISYPFWGGHRPGSCGLRHLNLVCHNNQYTTIEFISNRLSFRVLAIDLSTSRMTIARDDLWNNSICPKTYTDYDLTTQYSFINTTSALSSDVYYTASNCVINIHYGCNSEFIFPNSVTSNVDCPVNRSGSHVAFSLRGDETNPELVRRCLTYIEVPLVSTELSLLMEGKITLHHALDGGFEVEYSWAQSACSTCVASGGICGTDSSGSDQFICLCLDGPQSGGFCPRRNGNKMMLNFVIGFSAVGMGITCMVILYCKFKNSLHVLITRLKRNTKDDPDLEALVNENGALALNRYNYSDIKKITNVFQEKLGQGGYGNVYKGHLLDGRQVAVKVLSTSKENGEEFINEVAAIRRTAHVNVVTLLGFCLDGCKRALVYEFMPNGSLDKYIYYQSSTNTTMCCLGMEKLYEIAIGIAQGLEYLHRGCNTRILHFDIKPQNILLDKDFRPKISDFGLAKLCSTEESMVSMLGTRGTIGYIAPEVLSRHFGGVSYKSDVYSYGMMILEMVGGRKNFSLGVDRMSELYFPRWAYQRVVEDMDLGPLHDVKTEEENKLAKTMVLVGLWCIQTDPSIRPSMSKVLDMLEGNVETIEIPPKPFLCSPLQSTETSLIASRNPVNPLWLPSPRSDMKCSTTSEISTELLSRKKNISV